MISSDDAEHCLATYGTLAPGWANAHQLAGLRGTWTTGVVRGRMVEQGWGAAMGFPALVPDQGGDAVAVHFLCSPDLPAHWARLDDFEGSGYKRVAVSVETDGGDVQAYIYVNATAAI